MSYVKSVLAPNEQIVYRGRRRFTISFLSTTEMVITSRRFIFKRGWLARKTEEISLRRIEEVNLQQTFFGRIFGYGNIQIQGSGGSSISLQRLKKPTKFRRELQTAQAQAEER